MMSEKDFEVQTDMWMSSAKAIAVAAPSIDFLGWHGEHFVVVRSGSGNGTSTSGGRLSSQSSIELKELPTRRRLDCGKGVDLGSEDAAWLERKDVPMDYEAPALDS